MNHRDTETQRKTKEEARGEDSVTRAVIGARMEVHRILGPGLLESMYERALSFELELRKLRFRTQVVLPATYKGHQLPGAYRLDLVVEDHVVVEVKAVEELQPIHTAQLLTYMRVSGIRVGLVLNFRTPVLKDGIRRRSL